MAIDIKNVTAVQDSQQQWIIGHLCWYGIGEHLINRDELRQKLLNSGLEEGWMPAEIRVPDAFRRATREIQRRQKTNSLNIFLNFLVRDVFSDKDHVQRNIVIEKADKQGKRLDYNSQAAILLLDKKSATMSSQIFDSQVQELSRESEESFKIYKNNYSAQTLRVMAMNILKSMSPTPVRPNGGVYFVPAIHSEQLTRWVKFLSSLEKGEAYKVPMVDNLDSRKLVNKKLTEHLTGVIENCQNALHNGDVRKGDVKEVVAEAKRVIGDFNQYRNLVAHDIDRFENYVDKIRQQVTLLIESI